MTVNLECSGRRWLINSHSSVPAANVDTTIRVAVNAVRLFIRLFYLTRLQGQISAIHRRIIVVEASNVRGLELESEKRSMAPGLILRP
jgi:hypothetical protein